MSAPLNLVNLERVHKAHGTTVILDDVSLGVAAGERIGVVGRNGGGKSTLLSLLTGAMGVVTHDRWFLDEVCTTTWEVADGNVHSYDGGYSAYTLARAERARISSVAEERRLNLVRKELAWLRRGPPARTSKPKFRIEAAQALIADEPPARDAMALAGFAARRLGKSVYDVEDVDYAVRTEDGPRTLFSGLTWHVGPGDRIG